MVSGGRGPRYLARPSITPNQVKELLTSTAQELPAADPNTQSAGLVDLKRARDKPMPSVLASAQPFAPSTCLGSLEAARGSHLVADEDVELVARVTSSAPSTS